MRAKLREIAEQSAFNPKAALLNSLGLDSDFFTNPQRLNVRPWRYRVLVAQYIRPEKTLGGIYLADKTLQEDRFQGKVGLVLALGADAFADFAESERAALGDWIIYDPADAAELFIGDGKSGTPCRIIEDVAIKGACDDPTSIY